MNDLFLMSVGLLYQHLLTPSPPNLQEFRPIRFLQSFLLEKDQNLQTNVCKAPWPFLLKFCSWQGCSLFCRLCWRELRLLRVVLGEVGFEIGRASCRERV